MATTLCADCLLPPAHFGLGQSRRLWRFGLVVSLLLHAALLWLPVGEPRERSASRQPMPALTLTLKLPSPRAAAPFALPSAASVAPRGDSRPPRVRSRAVVAAPAVSQSVSASPPASKSVPIDVAPSPPLDLDGLRAQARDLARSDRSASPAAAPDPLEGARLEALARRIGKPLSVMSERRLADGSRMIRFAGNVCMHIPRHLPPGFENSFGPTVLLPTNCHD